MNRYALSQNAELDLLRILDYLESRSERAAAEMERRFVDAFIYLSEWPGSGHSREDLPSPNLKTWNVDNYVIVYGPDEVPLRIYAIVHGSRDMHSVFTGRPPIA
jgi:plasmid stabilization system protein ParE